MFMLPPKEANELASCSKLKFLHQNSDLVLDNGGIKVVLFSAEVPQTHNTKE